MPTVMDEQCRYFIINDSRGWREVTREDFVRYEQEYAASLTTVHDRPEFTLYAGHLAGETVGVVAGTPGQLRLRMKSNAQLMGLLNAA